IEFNEIVLKACAKDFARRYASADQMRADLELLQAGKSVQERRAAERRWTFVKKVGIAAAVGTMIVVALIGFRPRRTPSLDPLTTGKNVGGYPPTAMRGTTNKEAWDHYRLGYFAFR